MSGKHLPLSFLTPGVAETATRMMLDGTVYSPHFSQFIPQHDGHVIIVVPSVPDNGPVTFETWLEYPVTPHVLLRMSVGNPPETIINSAYSEAVRLWQGRSGGVHNVMPHLVFPGESLTASGVARHGIVVAYCGTAYHFGEMISGHIADACVALACEGYLQWLKAGGDTHIAPLLAQ